jgi:hypothetical protein
LLVLDFKILIALIKKNFFFVFIPFLSNVYSQTPIPLEEVKVFPDNFAITLIEKMKKATKSNLIKDFANCVINIKSIKNSNDTVIFINQNGLFQLKALKNRSYKFEELKGKSFYNHSFFDKNDFGSLLKYGSFYGRLNQLFEIDAYKFFIDFEKYKYQVSVKDNYYLVSFISDTYSGSFSIDKLSYNLLQLNFNLLKTLKANPEGIKIGIPQYFIQKANITESIDEAYITFKQNIEGKIRLSSLESRDLFDEFEIFNFEENKQNNLKYTNKFRYESFIKIVIE